MMNFFIKLNQVQHFIFSLFSTLADCQLIPHNKKRVFHLFCPSAFRNFLRLFVCSLIEFSFRQISVANFNSFSFPFGFFFLSARWLHKSELFPILLPSFMY